MSTEHQPNDWKLYSYHDNTLMHLEENAIRGHLGLCSLTLEHAIIQENTTDWKTSQHLEVFCLACSPMESLLFSSLRVMGSIRTSWALLMM